MNYLKNYTNYINYVKTLQRTKNKEVYYENHHILPKCCGGTNDKQNLILLTAQEHFLAHYLLCKIYKNSNYYYKLLCAFNYLSSNGKYKNSTIYTIFKQEKSRLQKQWVPWNKGLSGLKGHTKNKGRKQPYEEIEKRRLSLLGKKRTFQQKQNIKVGIGENWKKGQIACLSKTQKKIICNETKQIFISCNEAARTLHLSQGNISMVLNKQRKHTHNLTFSFV